jgi:hypothetical protein
MMRGMYEKIPIIIFIRGDGSGIGDLVVIQ